MIFCYLCGITLELNVDSNTKNHYEHIIPQALGGQLKKSGILCKTCGGEKYLGGKVDKPFSDIFKLITERIDIKKDRNTNSVSLQGKLHLLGTQECIDVRIKDSIISNNSPDYKIDYEKKIVYVLANEKIAKSINDNIQREFSRRVLQANSAEIKFHTIVIDTANFYIEQLSQEFDDVPKMYKIPQADWDKYLESINFRLENERGNEVSLVRFVGAAGTAKLTATIAAKVGTKAVAALSAKLGSMIEPTLAIALIAWDYWITS